MMVSIQIFTFCSPLTRSQNAIFFCCRIGRNDRQRKTTCYGSRLFRRSGTDDSFDGRLCAESFFLTVWLARELLYAYQGQIKVSCVLHVQF